MPLAADRTWIECAWAFAPESLAQPDSGPSYAVGFWGITNRQDWHACASVQRDLASAHAVPGPLSPQEDAVYQFRHHDRARRSRSVGVEAGHSGVGGLIRPGGEPAWLASASRPSASAGSSERPVSRAAASVAGRPLVWVA